MPYKDCYEPLLVQTLIAVKTENCLNTFCVFLHSKNRLLYRYIKHLCDVHTSLRKFGSMNRSFFFGSSVNSSHLLQVLHFFGISRLSDQELTALFNKVKAPIPNQVFENFFPDFSPVLDAGSNISGESGSGSRGLMTKNLREKKYS
jgi:hypothetical protein